VKLADIALDHEKAERGAWVDGIPGCGDLAIKTRGAGNADWRRLQAKLSEAVPASKRQSPEEAERIALQCLLAAGILDWRNLEGDDGPIPFSPETARRLLGDPKNRRLLNAALYAAGAVADEGRDSLEADLPNC
jgi:hypothetical protein